MRIHKGYTRLMASVLCATAGVAAAQSTLRDSLRSVVAAGRLGAGYAQMIELSATPDISAANYRIDGDQPGDAPARLDVFRLPVQRQWLALTPDTDLYWRLAGGYLQMRQDLAFGAGGVQGTWRAYSGSAGVLASMRLGNGVALEPALDVGLARLQNRGDYRGDAQVLQPLLDGLLFNWHANAWLLTPSVALQWNTLAGGGRASVRARVARSWISTFDETDPVQRFSEATNVYSLRGDFVRSTGRTLAGRPLDWLLYGSVAGFFGAHREALGFPAVAELGVGFELPLTLMPGDARRTRVFAGILRGPDVTGWTLGLNLPF